MKNFIPILILFVSSLFYVGSSLSKRFLNKSNIKSFLSIFSIIFLIFSIAIFNFIQNPFGIFPNMNFFEQPRFYAYAYTHEADFFNIKFRLDKTPYTRLITGGSSVPCSFNNDYLSDQELSFCFSAVLTRINFFIKAMKFFLKTHPTVKKVYFSLDFSMFSNKKSLRNDFSENITFKELTELLFSVNITKYSFKQMLEDILKKKENQNENQEMKIYPYATPDHGDCFISESFLDEISEIKEYCDEKNIEVTFFIPAYHKLFPVWFIKNNRYSAYQNYKREIAKRVDFIDFSISNEYTTLPFYKEGETVDFVPYLDLEHPYGYIGSMELQRLENRDNTIGILVNKDNIESLLTEETEQINQYMTTHIDVVEDFMEKLKVKSKDKTMCPPVKIFVKKQIRSI